MTRDLLGRGQDLHRRGRYEEAHEAIVECLETAANVRDGEALAAAMLLFAKNLLHFCPEGDDPFSARKAAAEEAIKLFRQIGDRGGEGRALLVLSSVDLRRGPDLAADSLSAARECGDAIGAAEALRHLANLRSICGDRPEAYRLASEAVGISRQEGYRELLSGCLFTLGLVSENVDSRLQAFSEMVALGADVSHIDFACRVARAASLVVYVDAELAAQWWNDCLAIARSLGNVELEGAACRGLAEVASSRGNDVKADELRVVADVLCPTPDPLEFERAAESGDMEAAWEIAKSMLTRKESRGSQDS